MTAEQPGPRRGPEDTEEQELRVLLERAVPRLTAPAQRLERVRERVRGRRRAAGVCAVLVAGVAAAGLMLPQHTLRGRTPGVATGGAGTVEPGAAPPDTPAAPPAARDTSPPPTTVSAPPYRTVRFAELPLVVKVPPAWRGVAVKGTAYLASGPLRKDPPVCPDPVNDYCLPLPRPMTAGGTLIVLQVADNPLLASKADRGRLLTRYPLAKSCLVEGGTEQWYVLAAAGTRPAATVLTGSVCLSHPTHAQRQEVQALLANADFS